MDGTWWERQVEQTDLMNEDNITSCLEAAVKEVVVRLSKIAAIEDRVSE